MKSFCRTMKLIRSIPTLLTVIVVAGVIALIPLSQPPLPISAYSDSDESETNTDQSLAQKNVGSDDSANFNCAETLIKAGADDNCDNESTEEPPEEGSATLFVCKVVEGNQEFEPFDFEFLVTGPGINEQFPGGPIDDPDPVCPPGLGLPGEVAPGEYQIMEIDNPGIPDPDSIEVEGDCIQDPNNPRIATVEIQEGETLTCTFTNIYEAGNE
jgi:hypothetical protein